ncbi:MAG: hypothetical protein ABJM11_17775 [Marinobacter sp.]|jgi:hypothetical protein|uniref:Uncharacterized protein n=1 Tax=Marinobacter aromaticivorans TaxID=1494078 RepID=A0ABW2IZ68_9GAMM|nr:hypothetical protein [Marinobacter aromaticivorans]GGE77333.1 hypothetical protein GCM10011533_32070 [Streptosporangium jomthongense]
MIRLLFGFILGVVASYFTFPMFYSTLGPLPKFSLENLLSEEQTLSSNTINPNPPAHFQQIKADALAEKISVARSLAQLNPPQSATTPEVLNVIYSAARKDPVVNSLFLDRASNGLTNQEALIILSAYGKRG